MTEEIIVTTWRHVFNTTNWSRKPESEMHSLPKFGRGNWQISLRANSTHLGFFLIKPVDIKKSSEVNNHMIAWFISIKTGLIDAREIVIESCISGDTKVAEFSSGGCWGYPSCVTWEQLDKYTPLQRVKNEFILEVEVKEVLPSSDHLRKQVAASEKALDDRDKLLQLHLVAFDKPEMSDAVFIFPSKSGKERRIFANKAVFSGACEYFNDMFSSSFSEAVTQSPLKTGVLLSNTKPVNSDLESCIPESDSDQSDTEPAEDDALEVKKITRPMSRIVIRDVAYKTYRALLVFILTKKIKFNDTLSPSSISTTASGNKAEKFFIPVSPKSIYRLADRYCITDLRDMAKEAILERLSPENVMDEVFSSFSREYEDIGKVDRQFLIAHWDELIKTLNWNSMSQRRGSNPSVVNVLQKICEDLAQMRLTKT